MEALVKLPGVGRKTANVVLGHALGVPGLPVDRHVLRVANRLGLVHSDDPEKVEATLCELSAARALDKGVRPADPARAAHLPADAALSDAATRARTATSSSRAASCVKARAPAQSRGARRETPRAGTTACVRASKKR